MKRAGLRLWYVSSSRKPIISFVIAAYMYAKTNITDFSCNKTLVLMFVNVIVIVSHACDGGWPIPIIINHAFFLLSFG